MRQGLSRAAITNYTNQCPACSGGSAVIHQRDYSEVSIFLTRYYGKPIEVTGRYEVRECDDCGTLFQAGRPDDALLKTIYNDWLTEPPQDVPNERDRGEIETVMAFFGKSQLRTFDFAMGNAAWARAALDLGCESHGIDLSDVAMAHACTHGIITNDDGEFDFINTEQAFEHMKSPAKTAAYLIGKLKPGGVLKISVPAKFGVDFSGDPPHTIHPLEHLNCFTEQGLCRMVGLPMVRPSIRQRYARRPRSLKEAVRPFWTWRNPKNLYRWFRKYPHAN
jgi:hypothetical protein